MCPDDETTKLTLEQKAQRDRYRAEKWPEYYAKKAVLQKTHEINVIGGIGAIHARADEDRWFAENTPLQFKEDYHPAIVHFAGLSCRYLQEFARRGNNYAIRELALLAVALTEAVEDMLDFPNADTLSNMRSVAAKLPSWPMLVHRHGLPRQRLKDITDLLRLGDDCPLNVSKSAKYSLRKPINNFVGRMVMHFHSVHQSIEWGKRRNETIERTLSTYIWRNETPIYKRSFKLKPLTKANAQQWADNAIMPLLRARYPDFDALPVLKRILEKSNPKPKGDTAKDNAIRKAVIQSLKSVSRPAKLGKIGVS